MSDLINIVDSKEANKQPVNEDTSLAVGIDFGTTNSVVSIHSGEEVDLVKDTSGRTSFPSAIQYEKNDTLFGHNVNSKSESYIIKSFKRLIGIDVDALKDSSLPFDINYQLSKEEGEAVINTAQGPKSITNICFDFFSFLLSITRGHLKDQNVSKAVITVPVYFNDRMRNAIKRAAADAKINVLRVINEPTSAALAYNIHTSKEGSFLVYDLGGGTFDVSLLSIHRGIIKVSANSGDIALGGDDIDAKISSYIINKYNIKDITKGSRDYINLLRASNKLKEKLTDSDIASTHIEGISAISKLNIELSIDELNDIILPFVNNTISKIHDMLDNLNIDSIESVIFVGGSTRSRIFEQVISKEFNCTLYKDINPDTVVSIGAGYQAALLNKQTNNRSILLDVVSLSLGVEMAGGVVEKIIDRNTTIPVSKRQIFTTFKDNQTGMILHIVQGEREMAEDCDSLSKFTLNGIPQGVAGSKRVEVTFSIDADGILTVHAKEKSSDTSITVDIMPTWGMNVSKAAEKVMQGMNHAKEDIEKRLLSTARVEATISLDAAKSALRLDSNLIDDSSIKKIESLIIDLEKICNHSNNRAEIEKARSNLENEMLGLVEIRMNSTVESMMKGKRVDDIIKSVDEEK